MDPSLSISTDPHHPPQFTSFPSFPTSFVSGGVPPNLPLFSGPGSVNPNPFNTHVFQPLPQPPQAATIPPHPSFNHPPYADMICAAIAALNEPDGSSKMAISKYIERFYPDLPPAHGALLTHHLKSLKNSGVLAMVKKSYKFTGSSPPTSLALAASVAMEVPRSEILPTNTINESIDPVAVTGSASQSQKRGRGRPPKTKPESQQQESAAVQPSDVNGQQIWEKSELALTKPTEEVQESAKRGRGRPRKDGTAPIVHTSVMSGILKRRGRPAGRRAAGRQRKPKSVSSTASVFPYVSNGARRRGRPRRIDSSTAANSTSGEIVAVGLGNKRGRGRPPKIGGVISRIVKPKRGRGRPVGRPRKAMLGTGATGTQDSGYGELKKKFDIFQEKAKEIVNVLKGGLASDNESVMHAIQELEGLIAMEAVEPLPPLPPVVEEVQPEEAEPPHTETQNEEQEEEHREEREGGDAQIQTEAEAMQEALF